MMYTIYPCGNKCEVVMEVKVRVPRAFLTVCTQTNNQEHFKNPFYGLIPFGCPATPGRKRSASLTPPLSGPEAALSRIPLGPSVPGLSLRTPRAFRRSQRLPPGAAGVLSSLGRRVSMAAGALVPQAGSAPWLRRKVRPGCRERGRGRRPGRCETGGLEGPRPPGG